MVVLSLACDFLLDNGGLDGLVVAAHRAQADALEIEAGAKRRLADEYDAAQERGKLLPKRVVIKGKNMT